MYEKLSINRMIKKLKAVCGQFPDNRTGQNIQYDMTDGGMGAFSVFFTQSASIHPLYNIAYYIRFLMNWQNPAGFEKLHLLHPCRHQLVLPGSGSNLVSFANPLQPAHL